LRDPSEVERFGRLIACFIAIAAEIGEI